MLELQQEKALVTATTWHKKQEEALETIKLKEMETNELQKKIIEEKNKLRLQQALYEYRNLFSQQHIEAQDEIAEVWMNHYCHCCCHRPSDIVRRRCR